MSSSVTSNKSGSHIADPDEGQAPARLLHDSDAQKWLDYEIMGYPPVFIPAELGTFRKHYTSERPVLRDERTHKPHAIGLPQLESYIHATNPDVIQKLGPHENQKIQIVNRDHEMVNDFERLKTAIHNYVTEVNIALSVGESAEDISRTRGVQRTDSSANTAPGRANNSSPLTRRCTTTILMLLNKRSSR